MPKIPSPFSFLARRSSVALLILSEYNCLTSSCSRKLEKVVYVGSRNFLPPIVTVSVSKVRPFFRGVSQSNDCSSANTQQISTILSEKYREHRTAQTIGTNTVRGSEHGEEPKNTRTDTVKKSKSLFAIFVGFLMDSIVDLVTGRKSVLSSFKRGPICPYRIHSSKVMLLETGKL